MRFGFPLPGCCAAALLWTLAAPLGAEPASTTYAPPDPFETLQKALRAEREVKARASGGAVTAGGYYESRGYVETIRQSLERGEDTSATSALAQLEGVTTTEDVRRACEVLIEKISKEHAVKAQAFNAELEIAIKRAGETVLAAKEPKELDGLIAEFQRMSETHGAQFSDGRDNRTTQKIQGVITFLSRWQEYLVAQKKGDDQAAASALRNLTESGYNHTPLVARSEILARIPNSNRNSSENSSNRPARNAAEVNNAVAAMLDEAHTLDDIPAVLVKLLEYWTKVTGNQLYAVDNTSDLGASISNLQSLQKAQAELRAGLTTTINLAALRAENSSRPAVDVRLAGLRAELLKLALPRLLGAPEIKANANEGAADFLRRLIDAAKGRGDWAAVARGLEMARTFTSNQTAYSTANVQEGEAFKLFFAGLNMEVAGQYEQAAVSFLNALKTGVQDLPTAVIGEHLAAIQKAHPKEYDDASSYVLNPPVRTYGEAPYVPNTRRIRPGSTKPGDPAAPAVEFTIPALTPSPSPTAPAVKPAP